MFLVFQIMLNLHLLLDRRQRGPIRYKIVVVGNWLVGNAVFSETALRMFLIFCMKLWNCKGRKATEPGFSKKFLVWRYSRKLLQISIGWLVGSLVGWLVTQFFQKRLKWFFGFFAWSYEILKVEKSQSRIFEKNSWFGDFRKKVSKLAQNHTLWYFSQKRL